MNSEITSLESSLQNHKDVKLTLAAQFNNLIQGIINTFIIHEKLINSLAIQRVSNPQFALSSSDQAQVLTIAGLCPKIYGNSVYLARTFLTSAELFALGGSNSCNSSLISKSNNLNFDSTLIVSTIVNNKLFINGLNINYIYKFEIVNSEGAISSKYLNGDHINIEDFPSGIYYLMIRNQNGNMAFRKFVKI